MNFFNGIPHTINGLWNAQINQLLPGMRNGGFKDVRVT
jgi:hypothetical protein